MNELHFPWLAASILVPLMGAAFVARLRDAEQARKWCLVFTGIAFVLSVGEFWDFTFLDVPEAADRWHLMSRLTGRELFRIDELSAPLLPLASLLYMLTAMATVRTKIRRFSFSWTLVSEAILLATFACKDPWAVIVLLSLATIPPYLELRARGKPTRVYLLHMGLFVALLVIGWTFVTLAGANQRVHTFWAIVPLLGAVLIRSGIAPFHCWMTDLFEHATFGTALLYTTPLVGAYAAVRLVLPIAPDWVLRSMGVISLFTAVYAGGMALVQREGRRFFCYLFLSHSALILVGLEMVTPIGLTGALCMWLAVGLGLGGFGLTLRAMEARRGRLSLAEYQGFYEHTPTLAAFYAFAGLASIGFPGTLGFIGIELLVDGAVEAYPYIGVAVVIAAALNGIAVVHSYFILFTGTRYASSVSLGIGPRERFAVLTLTGLLLVGGIVPQFNIASRHHAAEELLEDRRALALDAPYGTPRTLVTEADDAPHKAIKSAKKE